MSRKNAKKKKSSSTQDKGATSDSSNPREESDGDSYEVQDIIDDRVEGGKTQYKIRWKGFSEDSDTWENESNLNCEDLIIMYLERKDAADVKEKTEEMEAVKKLTPQKGTKRKAGTEKKKQEITKPNSKLSDGDSDGGGDSTEPGKYELERIRDVHLLKNGKRLFRVKWRGYSVKEDTWEPEENLKGTKVLESFLRKMEEAKEATQKQLRVVRKHTNHYTLQTTDSGRRLSRRNTGKQRATYHGLE